MIINTPVINVVFEYFQYYRKDLFSIVYHQIYIFLDKSNKIYIFMIMNTLSYLIDKNVTNSEASLFDQLSLSFSHSVYVVVEISISH